MSIAGNNSAGEGEISTRSVILPTGIISSMQVLLYGIHSNHFWIFSDSWKGKWKLDHNLCDEGNTLYCSVYYISVLRM